MALGSDLPEDSLLLPEPHDLLKASLCNIVRQFGSLRGWTATIADLPNIVRLIVRRDTQTTATVPVSEKPYDLREVEKNAYISHGEPKKDTNRAQRAPSGLHHRNHPNYRTKLQASPKMLQVEAVRGMPAELPNHRAEPKSMKCAPLSASSATRTTSIVGWARHRYMRN